MAFDKLIDHLPFFDGAARRRFVAGGIILIGIAMQSPGFFEAYLGQDKLQIKDILGSPVIAGGTVLLVYAIGSLAEMLGELSLVRAASGIFLALQFPGRVVTWEAVPNRHWFYGFLIIIIKILLYVAVVPFMVLYFAAAGFVGYTKYAIDISGRASDKAQAVFNNLPDAAKRGLHQPVGNDTDFAQKYIVDLLTNEPDRKWARRLIIRAKDVAATITALQVVLLYTLLSFGFEPGDAGQKAAKPLQLQNLSKKVIAAADALQEQDESLRGILFLGTIRGMVGRNVELAGRHFPRSRILSLRSRQNALESDRNRVESGIAQLDKELEELKRATTVPHDPKLQLQRGVEDTGAEKARQMEEKRLEDKRRSLMRRRDALKRRPDNTEVLKLVKKEDTATRITKLQDAMTNYNGYFATEKEERLVINLALTGAWLFFLPLYLGYFTTLRNAIAAILEAVAAADDGATVPEGAE